MALPTKNNIITLKLLVDKNTNRVIFAEAEKEFVDLLFYILSLPLGTVTNLLSGELVVGSLGNVYTSLQQLSTVFVHPGLNKSCLLNPYVHVKSPSSSGSPFLPPLKHKLGISSILPTATASAGQPFYRCSQASSKGCFTYVVNDPNRVCGTCKNKMSSPMTLVANNNNNSEMVGYVKEEAIFMIKDNLNVEPMSGISGVMLVNELKLNNLGNLEHKLVYVGTHEWLMILKASLKSKTVLTDVFLLNKPKVPNYDDDEDEEDEDYVETDEDDDDYDGADDDDYVMGDELM